MTATKEICHAFFNLGIEDEMNERIIQRLHDLILKFKRLKASKYYLIVQKTKREIKSNPSFLGLRELLGSLFDSINTEQNMKFDIIQMFLITEVFLEHASKYISSDDYNKLKNAGPGILAESIQRKYKLNAAQWMVLTNDWIEDVASFVQNVTFIGLILYSMHHLLK